MLTSGVGLSVAANSNPAAEMWIQQTWLHHPVATTVKWATCIGQDTCSKSTEYRLSIPLQEISYTHISTPKTLIAVSRMTVLTTSLLISINPFTKLKTLKKLKKLKQCSEVISQVHNQLTVRGLPSPFLADWHGLFICGLRLQQMTVRPLMGNTLCTVAIFTAVSRALR